MFRPRTIVVGLLLALAGIGLVGCSDSSPTVVPLSEKQRIAMADRYADNVWAGLQADFPASPRPSSGPTRLLHGKERTAALLRCAEKQGLMGVSVDAGGSLTAEGTSDGTGLQDLGTLACSWQYPDPRQAALYFSESQLGAIYDYDRGFLQPCLVAAGIRITPAPAREAFIAGGGTFYSTVWNPYFGSIDQQRALADKKLQQYCPPWPEWAHVPAFS